MCFPNGLVGDSLRFIVFLFDLCRLAADYLLFVAVFGVCVAFVVWPLFVVVGCGVYCLRVVYIVCYELCC